MATAADDVAVEKANWHWRNSMRPVRFFNMDARAVLPFLLLLVYARWVTLALTIFILIFFRILEGRGLTFPAAMRSIRLWFVGDHRSSWYSYAHRRMRDFG